MAGLLLGGAGFAAADDKANAATAADAALNGADQASFIRPACGGAPHGAAAAETLTRQSRDFVYLRPRATPSQRGAAHLQGWETS